MPMKYDGKQGSFTDCVSHYSKKGMNSKSANKMCGAIKAKQEKEHGFLAILSDVSFKEDEGEFYSEGFIATTHKDRVGDICTNNVIKKIVNTINNKTNPSAGLASDRHDWLKQGNDNLPLAGKALKAEERDTGDGHIGAWVVTHHNKAHPDFENIKYQVEHGYYPGYSIEYDNAQRTPTKEGNVLTDLELVGYGFANGRLIANPMAAIEDFYFKEIMEHEKENANPYNELVSLKEKKEVSESNSSSKSSKKEIEGDTMPDENKPGNNEPEDNGEQPSGEEESQNTPEDNTEGKEMKEMKEQKEFAVSQKDYNMIQKMRQEQERDAKMKEIQAQVKSQVQSELEALRGKQAPVFNTDDGKPEFKEFDAFQNSLVQIKELDKSAANATHRESRFQGTVDAQYKEAARLCDSFMEKGINPYKNWRMKEMNGVKLAPEPADVVEFPRRNAGSRSLYKEVAGRIEAKEFARLRNTEMKSGEGLQTDTNLADASWTYGSYYLSPVELNDIFQPVMVNQLNDQTITFGRLRKEDFSGLSQIQFRARTARNSTAGGYSEGTNLTYGTDFTGNVGRDKFQQPYCYYRVLCAITGQSERFSMAPGGMGDVWADEIKWSMEDLMVTLNQAILGTGDGTAENESLGFEGLILGTTGTLYGKNIATYSSLQSHKENMSSKNVTTKQLRKMIRYATGMETSGDIKSTAIKSNLAFFTNGLQVDNVKGLLQAMQHLVPTSARAGFEGEVEFDGVPVVGDHHISTDDIFLIDTAHTKLGINLPPTLEPLPVTADAKSAHIKTYFNLYSDAPGNNYWGHTFGTS